MNKPIALGSSPPSSIPSFSNLASSKIPVHCLLPAEDNPFDSEDLDDSLSEYGPKKRLRMENGSAVASGKSNQARSITRKNKGTKGKSSAAIIPGPSPPPQDFTASHPFVLVEREFELEFSEIIRKDDPKFFEDLPQDFSMEISISHYLVNAKYTPENLHIMGLSFEGANGLLFRIHVMADKLSDSDWEDIKNAASLSKTGNKNYFSAPCQIKSSAGKISVHISIRCAPAVEWNKTSLKISKSWYEMISKAFPNGAPVVEGNSTRGDRGGEIISPPEFYNSVHVPDKSIEVPDQIQPAVLECNLLPYQRRAVQWMLRRECADIDSTTGKMVPYDNRCLVDIPPTFFENFDKKGCKVYVSHLLGVITSDLDKAREMFEPFNGGILAEEMGLGKTVEAIVLIALHRRNFVPGTLVDYGNRKIDVVGSTLIVCPSSILDQWKSEIALHAPTLKVFHYKGLKHSFYDTTNQEIKDELSKYDIILTTYNVLSSEVHYAQTPSTRSLRHGKKYEPRRSPLVEMEFWRCCLDEAQMIEGGYSNAATVARLIPRVNSWAVSGTPIKSDINDCYGLLLFFQFEPFASYKDTWQRLTQYNHQAFKDLFRSFTLRHSKHHISSELHLPPQNRVMISVPFSQIEQQNYNQLFQQMCTALKVDELGAPTIEDWDPEDYYDPMRAWLTRLRQTCLHPEAGLKNRKALGGKNGPLRTVKEVLELMIEQFVTKLRTDERSLYQSMVKRGQLHEMDKEPDLALKVWKQVLPLVEATIKDCRAALKKEQLMAKKYRAKVIAEMRGVPAPKDEEFEVVDDNEYEVEAEEAEESGWEDEDDDDRIKKLKMPDHIVTQMAHARARLRNFLEVQHSCLFWVATAYHQLSGAADAEEEVKEEGLNVLKNQNAGKMPEKSHENDYEMEIDGGEARNESANNTNPTLIAEYTAKETEYYSHAQTARKELMSSIRTRALQLIGRLRQKAKDQSFVEVPDIPEFDLIGLRSRGIIEKINDIGDYLNSQVLLLDDWRETMIQILTEPLFDEDSEEANNGDENEKATAAQEKSYAYMSALRLVLARRQEVLTGSKNQFILDETQKILKTPERIEIDLFRKLVSQSQEFYGVGNMRGLVAELRGLAQTLKADGGHNALVEAKIAENELHNVSDILTIQTKAVTNLFSEIENCRVALNSRMDFYRQLQIISDTLLPLDTQKEYNTLSITPRLYTRIEEEETKLSNKISNTRAKIAYLSHLRSCEGNSSVSPDCLICLSPYELGVMTACGHSLCKTCLIAWLKQSRKCPQCREPISLQATHQIVYKPTNTTLIKEPIACPSSSSSQPSSFQLSSSQYSPSKSHGGPKLFTTIDSNILREIRAIHLPSSSSYGSKIDMITRHTLWLRAQSAQVVIFSQWADVLDVIKTSLRSAGVLYASLDSSKPGDRAKDAESGTRDRGVTGGATSLERFKTDREVTAFLLHAKSQSAGLTLVNATHVVLCEPLVNVPLELQAISRVHRIGQKKPTTVWVWTVEGTVEASVLELSMKRRLDMVEASASRKEGKRKEGEEEGDRIEEEVLEKVQSEVMKDGVKMLVESAPGGGEVVRDGDLWECLFKAAERRVQVGEGLTMVEGEEGEGVRREILAGAAEGRLEEVEGW